MTDALDSDARFVKGMKWFFGTVAVIAAAFTALAWIVTWNAPVETYAQGLSILMLRFPPMGIAIAAGFVWSVYATER